MWIVVRPANGLRVVTQTQIKWEAALEQNATTLSRTSQQAGLRRDWAEPKARERLPGVI